jgi:hypothetical protein
MSFANVATENPEPPRYVAVLGVDSMGPVKNDISMFGRAIAEDRVEVGVAGINKGRLASKDSW